MNSSRYAEAIEYYKKALEFETDDPVISFKMAEASRKYKDYDRAAAWYGKIMVGDRENSFPLAMFRYAEMKKYLGMYEESANDCQQTLDLNPYHFGAAIGMAHCYLELDDPVGALQYFRRAIDINPSMEGVRAQIDFLQRSLEER